MKPTYSVILRSGLPPREAEFLEIFCGKITSASGEDDLLHFLCTKVDTSHPTYIEMETFHPVEKALSVVRIPHHFVLLIDGSEERPSIGFMPS